MQTSIQKRAIELVEKGFMPWREAEKLALSEFGIGDGDIEELQGECSASVILTGDEIPGLIRAVLVHGAGLLVRHDLYTDNDSNIPASICDRNGQVALGLCKRCGRAEIELSEPCTALRFNAEITGLSG